MIFCTVASPMNVATLGMLRASNGTKDHLYPRSPGKCGCTQRLTITSMVNHMRAQKKNLLNLLRYCIPSKLSGLSAKLSGLSLQKTLPISYSRMRDIGSERIPYSCEPEKAVSMAFTHY